MSCHVISSVFIPVISNSASPTVRPSPERTRSLNSSWNPLVSIRLMKKLYSVSWKTLFLFLSFRSNSPFKGVTDTFALLEE